MIIIYLISVYLPVEFLELVYLTINDTLKYVALAQIKYPEVATFHRCALFDFADIHKQKMKIICNKWKIFLILHKVIYLQLRFVPQYWPFCILLEVFQQHLSC